MDSAEKPKKASLKLFIISGALLVLAGAGVGWYLFFSPQAQEGSLGGSGIWAFMGGEKKSSGDGQGHLYKMDPFLVNLVDPGQLRYLKITIHVESNRDKMNEEYEKRLPQLRDAILTILSAKNYKEIMSSEGKKALREEIKKEMNQILTDFKVRNVYFTEFVIQ